MDTINFDDHNVILNDQPYLKRFVRAQFPTSLSDRTVTLFFPEWTNNVLWTGDVATLVNVNTHAVFTDVSEFKDFCRSGLI